MTHHSGTLAELVSRIRSANPWDSFPPTSYLDTQAILLWMRLGVFDEAIELLEKPNEHAKRWQIEAEVRREVYGTAIGGRWFTESQVAGSLEHPNIHLNPPAPRDSAHTESVAHLRRWIADEELKRNSSAPQSQRRHLGEADTITVIARVDQGSVFVTGDVGAFEVARWTDGVVPVRGLALVAGVIAAGTVTFDQIWQRLCDTRACLASQKPGCHAQLTCPHLSVASANSGVLSRKFSNGGVLAGEMVNDFEELATGLGLAA